MIDIKRLIQQLNDPDLWPDDDKTTEDHKIEILNRIDQEHGCDWTECLNPYEGYSYCELPEHDPFTNRCRDRR